MLDSTSMYNNTTKSTNTNESLTPLERQYILLTQTGLPLISQPYHWLAEQLNVSVEQTLTMTEDFLARGIIRRIAAVPNHYKLGYSHNGMTVWDVQDQHVSAFGDAIGKLPFVSHCYLRPRHLPHWNYNLFAMVHGKSSEEINAYREQIKQLLDEVLTPITELPVQSTGQNNDMLISSKILKKTGLRLKSSQQKGQANV